MNEGTNTVSWFNRRQIDGKRLQRTVMNLLLKSQDTRKYICTWKKSLKHAVTYDGNLYIEKFSQYFQGCYIKNKPHFLRTNHTQCLPPIFNDSNGRLIKDTLPYETPVINLNDTNGLICGNYSHCLFALTYNSYILQYHIGRTGWSIKRMVYLGRRSFSHLNYDCQQINFVAKTIRQKITEQNSIVYYFTVFQAAPFEFLFCFGVPKEIFGSFKDAFVINGMLVILSNTAYEFYSLDYIVQEFQFKTYKFDDRLDPGLDEFLGDLEASLHLSSEDSLQIAVGNHPCGLPINIKITSKPPCLFQVPSKEVAGLSFGGFPWYCLACRTDESILYDVKSQKVVGKLCHNKSSESINHDEKKAYFHPDRSGRLLCVDYDSVICYKVVETDTKEIQFQQCFELSYQKMSQKTNQVKLKSRSGRIYKPIRPVQNDRYDIIHSLDYDDDLNTLGILYTDIKESSKDVYVLGLYDNETGLEVRRFKLEFPVSQTFERELNIFINNSLVICTAKKYGQIETELFIYQLVEV